MKNKNFLKTDGQARPESIVSGKNYRITVLTSKLFRLEYSESGVFEDRPTQSVINRNFETPAYTVQKKDGKLEIITEDLQLIYDEKPFSGSGLSIFMKKLRFGNNSVWRYGDKGMNLKGTARTLDRCNGATELEDGVLSVSGYAVIDDSKSMALNEDGWIEPPLQGHTDIYFFGYSHEFKECIKDFYHLCGSTPMLPRYVLGNWWSRYHAYTQEEYLNLINRFEEEKLPFSVGVMDMDWHWVELDPKYGSGWTGYTWNTDLFPDHVGMLKELHDKGMRVTANVHPADGIRGHEKAYKEMAQALGVDWENEVPIAFDIASREFLDAYFKYLHHPLEEEGIDFWWIDWQQGNSSNIPGLDPLWMLNHYHYEDQCRDNKRGLVFSRYAGPGSNRYPIGFSGDTHITWESLDFQPYFTATASNIGYDWWSHDIGGHMMGYRDDELATRWVQYGVFSPIMRLHSSNSKFSGKEPWNFGKEHEAAMGEFLRLRHMMVPYLYTMSERAHRENEPLIQPMYYNYEMGWELLKKSNQYFFGTELLVNPITHPADEATGMGSEVTWLPEGTWYDIFTGLRYSGGKKIRMFRTIESIPVLAKAGGIVPMQTEETVSNHTDNPEAMKLLVFPGKDGSFKLYEDDGLTMDYEKGLCVTTDYVLKWGEEKSFTIEPAVGELSLIPEKRSYEIDLYSVCAEAVKGVTVDGVSTEYAASYNAEKNVLTISLDPVCVTAKIVVEICEKAELAANPVAILVEKALMGAQMSYMAKDALYRSVCGNPAADAAALAAKVCSVNAMDVPNEIKEMLQEILMA